MLVALLTAPAWTAFVAGHARAAMAAQSCRTVSTNMLTEQEQRVAESMQLKAVDSESPRASGLALLLDDGTRKSHSVAENTAFVTGFFRGIATEASFASLVASLYFVYKAMESAFDSCTDPSVRALDYPELRRLAPLESDMDYWFGPAWRDEVRPSEATRAYVYRIEKVAAEEPHLLVAHMYTRYLGDLFGGQMMGGMARRSLGLEGAGTAFYEFVDIPESRPFIDAWYRKLNSLDLSAAQKEAVVDEGNLVFALNIGIFDELDGNPGRALWTLARDALRRVLGLGGRS